MPGPNGNNVQPATNAEGKIYPWAIEGRDYATFKAMDGFGIQLSDNASLIGKKKEVDSIYSHMCDELTEEHELAEPGIKANWLGGETTADLVFFHENSNRHFTPEEMPVVMEDYRKLVGIEREVSSHLRTQYQGKEDHRSRMLQGKADQLADMMDLDADVANPEAGNLFKSFFDAPYIVGLRAVAGGAPKFGPMGIEGVVNVLDKPGETPIYDDYMTVMGAMSRELKVQQYRQQGQKDGWDAEKEHTYLNDLRREHQKTIEAADRLWEVDDHGQYDSALNNQLDALVGKKKSNRRDMNGSIGFMRGEVQAIDMGYDSNHLHVLGELGMQEQWTKKLGSELAIERADREKSLEEYNKDPAEWQKNHPKSSYEQLQEDMRDLEQREKRLNEYSEDLNKFKEGVWDKKVNSKEDMEAVGKEVDGFLSSHKQAWKEMGGFALFSQATDYLKEEASKAPEIPKYVPGLHTGDMNSFMQLRDTLENVLGGEEKFPGMSDKILTTFAESGAHKTGVEVDDRGHQSFTADFDKQLKNLAQEVIDKLDANERDREKDSAHPAAERLRAGFVEAAKIRAGAVRDGLHIDGDKGMQELGFFGVDAIGPQFNMEMFKPENADKLENALKQFPLDKFVEKGNEIQRMKNEYAKKEAGMSDKEKQAFQDEIKGYREDMLGMAVDLKEKALNPTPETISLFGKPSYLTNPTTGFIGNRGLQNVIDGYGAELSRTNVPGDALEQLSESMDKFNTKRNIFAGKESDEHRLLREAASKVQDNMKKLESGMITDATGAERPMTQKEKLDLIGETNMALNDLSDKASDYIRHSEKDGKAPSTGAGKQRLEGAKEIKDLTNRMQEHMQKEEQKEAKRQAEYVKKQAGGKQKENKVSKENGRKQVSIDKLTKEEKEKAHSRDGRKSVREPRQRQSISSKHGKNDVMQSNKAVVPKKK